MGSKDQQNLKTNLRCLKQVFNRGNINVAFMGGSLESEFRISKNQVDMLFPEATGFGVALKSTLDRKNHAAIEGNAEPFEKPFRIGIIDAHKSGDGRWWRAGILGINSISSIDDVVHDGSEGNKEAGNGLLNA